MMAFMVKKMLPAIAQHAAQEYETDQAKTFDGRKKEAVMRDGFEAEYLWFPSSRSGAPLLIDFYGGGYIGGNIYKEIELCQRYRDTLDINVAALSYRYGPAYSHPQALMDAYDGMAALTSNATLDFDRNNLILEGHSAGAHLAVCTALYNLAQENIPIRGMILDYPFFDARKASLKKLPKVKYALSPMIMDMMYHGYFVTEEAASDAYASPFLATDEQLMALPSMYINTCENDNLKYSAQTFCQRLNSLSISYTLHEEKGAVHGYVEQCSNDTMKTLKDYPRDINALQYKLYENAFVRFCSYIHTVTGQE